MLQKAPTPPTGPQRLHLKFYFYELNEHTAAQKEDQNDFQSKSTSALNVEVLFS